MFMSIGMFRQVEITATVGSSERRTHEAGCSSRRRSIFWGL
jgi:hypothetical protein